MPALQRDPWLLSQRIGRWRWPWAIIGTVLATGFIFVAVSGLGAVLGDFVGSGTADDIKMFVPGEPGTYAVVLAIFLPMIVVPIAVYRILHRRSWSDWPFASGGGRWPEFLKAAGAFLLVVSIGFLIARVLFPSRFASVPRGLGHLPWFMLGLGVVLVQAFAEEVAFKGYLYRVWGAVLPYRWLVVTLLSVVFTSLHWDNTDFARDRGMAVIQFMVGSFISFWLYLRTESLAAPTGLHWANNIFAMLILANTPGEFGVSALATYTDPVLAAGGTNLTDAEAWLALILGNAAFFGLVAHPSSPLFIAASSTLPAPKAPEPASDPDAPPPAV